jgi:transcriptional regulator with XRE-family HTH domain
MEVKEIRIKSGLSQQELADATGIPRGRISQWELGNGSPKKEDYDILAKYFAKKGISISAQKTINNDATLGVPVYDIEFTAGFLESIRDKSPELVTYINMPEVQGCDYVIRAKGDSMANYINNQDWIGIKRVDDIEVLNYGQPYAIVTKDMLLIKYVRKSKLENNILLKSENANYDDFELPLKKVLELYLVKTVIPIKTII